MRLRSGHHTWAAAVLLACMLVTGGCKPGYGTRLPMSEDLTAVRPQLEKLSPEDRALVEGYVARSHGDVMPARFADPDEPFTARTFGEAIELQKDWLKKHGEWQAKQATRDENRERAWAPMRAALRVELIKREILPGGMPQASATTDITAAPATTAPDHGLPPKLVSTYRIENTSPMMIQRAEVIANVLDASGSKRTYCYFDLDAPLASGATREIPCGMQYGAAGKEDREFLAIPSEQLHVVIEPRLIQFEDGKTLHEL